MLIILQAMTAVPQTVGTDPGPLSFGMKSEKDSPPSIALDVQNVPGTKVGKMVGVETTIIVSLPPAATTLTFGTKELCDAAAEAIKKQTSVGSVTCVQTQ